MKSKTIRVDIDDAMLIEQRARELAAKLRRDVSVSEVFHEIIKGIENVKIEAKKKPR